MNTPLAEMETEGFKSLTFPFDGQNVSGSLVQHENISANPSTVIYFNAGTNLSPVLERVTANKGEILTEMRLIKSGFIAHALDSEGNRIGIFAL